MNSLPASEFKKIARKCRRRGPRSPFNADGKLSESSRQKQIMAWLDAIGIFVKRRNVGTAKHVKDGRTWYVKYGEVVGASDITGTIPITGRRIEIETKSARGKESNEQLAWQNTIRRLGAVAFTARSIAEVEAELLVRLTPVELKATVQRVRP